MSRIAIFFRLVISPAMAMILALLGLETRDANLLGWLLLIVGVVYGAGVVIVYWVLKKLPYPLAKGDHVRQKIERDGSFWVILPGVLITFFLPPLELIYFAPSLMHSIWMEMVGIVFILAGTCLFGWAQAIVRRSYAGRHDTGKWRPLIQVGPFRSIRHPDYAGSLLIAAGICVGYRSLIGLTAIPVLLLPAFVFCIQKDERALAYHFGERFRRYASETARLIPGVW